MLDPFAFETYFAARLAFVDRPRVRIGTRDELLRVDVRLQDDEGRWMEYAVARDHPGVHRLVSIAAERARREWELAEHLAEPREAFDLDKLAAHLREVAAAFGTCDLVVRQAWGRELAMRLEPTSVFVSPEVHHRLILQQDQLEREHRLAQWFARSGVV